MHMRSLILSALLLAPLAAQAQETRISVAMTDGKHTVTLPSGQTFGNLLVIPKGQRIALSGGGYLEGPLTIDGEPGSQIDIEGAVQ